MKILAKIYSSSTKQCGIYFLLKKNNKYVWGWIADEDYYKKYPDLFVKDHISYKFIINQSLKPRIKFDHQDILEHNLCE